VITKTPSLRLPRTLALVVVLLFASLAVGFPLRDAQILACHADSQPPITATASKPAWTGTASTSPSRPSPV
jgi:hypothetical protein